MKKATTIRRIIGITALVLWVVAVVALGKDYKLIWQLDSWAMGIALVLTPVYAFLLAICLGRGRHWLIKVVSWIGCGIVAYVCIVMLAVFVELGIVHRVWSNREYVVYSEHWDFSGPEVYAIYKRDGLINRRMYGFRSGYGQVKKAEYTIYDNLDLMREEADVTLCFECDSICHETAFYRLNGGERYDETANDSLLALTNNLEYSLNKLTN